MKNLIIVIALISICGLTSCSTSEHCAAYSDVTKFKQQKRSNHSASTAKSYRKYRGGRSYGCYYFQ
jgi:hypothetical protein